MTSRDPSARPKKSLLLSLAMGALLVPLSAYGASSLFAVTTGGPAPVPLTTQTTSGDVPATPVAGPADIDVACGEEGMQLVAAEAGGSIGEVQQAALDALRDICTAAGMPLPEPAAPAVAPPTTANTPTASVRTSDDSDDDDDHGGDGGHRDDDDPEDDD